MMQEQAFEALKALFPKEQLYTDQVSLLSYEVDAGLDKALPEAVVFPKTVDEVVELARWSASQRIPLVARGAGTGLSGGAVAEQGGLVVDFTHMNHIQAFDPHEKRIQTEPALINLRLDEYVGTCGLYFPPDPGSQRASTIGGNVAENAGGPHCFKYGVTTNYVTGLEVVLAGGRLVHLGGLALDYPEYDLCGLLTGSEGTLGLITSLSLRLLRRPPAVKTLLAVFDSVERAGEAVSAVIASGLVPATMEMMDRRIVRMIEAFAHAGLPLDAEAVLIVEFDGYAASLNGQTEEVTQILQRNGGYGIRIARNEEERARIWLARKSAAGAIAREVPAQYTIDITVPRSRLAETLAEISKIGDRHHIRLGHVFHAGDGNLHPMILIPDPDDSVFIEHVHTTIAREMVLCSIEKGGSLTGEHGVGIEKRDFMPLMHTAAELSAMQQIKRAFDPANLLNPGKVLPLVQSSEQPQLVRSTKQDDSPIERVMKPMNTDEVSAYLQRCVQDRQSLFVHGREHSHLGRPQMILSELKGVKVYAPDDLYITVGAGMPLAEIQTFLAGHDKRVALASPWPQMTVGGLIAANVNAPLRMRYGAIRDNVLCATAVLADGRVIRTGRPLVKNVAGYDLTKVFIGSYGTLGVLTDVSLKIYAQPRAKRTIALPIDDVQEGLCYCRELFSLALNATAIVLCRVRSDEMFASSYALVYSVEGIPEDVQCELEQVQDALRLLEAPATQEITTFSGTELWSHMCAPSTQSTQAMQAALLLRIGLPQRELPTFLAQQGDLLYRSDYLVDYASSLIYLPYQYSDDENAIRLIGTLRQAAKALGGYAVVMDMPGALEGIVDRWGYQNESFTLMQRLKAQWDPYTILNPHMLL
jgi:glycolate oxidase subunit GlcD